MSYYPQFCTPNAQISQRIFTLTNNTHSSYRVQFSSFTEGGERETPLNGALIQPTNNWLVPFTQSSKNHPRTYQIVIEEHPSGPANACVVTRDVIRISNVIEGNC